MDETDIRILEILQENSKISNKKLSEKIGLNPSSTLERVKKLENKEIIKKYTALLNMEKLGFITIAFIQVSLKRHNKQSIEKFIKSLEAIPEIVEFYHIAGRYDYMLKIYVKSNKQLQRFLMEKITSIEIVDKTETMLVFQEKKYDLKISAE